ncbi:hypothetical protein JOF48_002747 [Arthrobacter stackebrandtii]|uniref:Uncharacterized protein n=1 Tax=Arthrobacter stackebrandtii TaxID=272161 RepID=A0ABS4YYT2_9MICC|nr:hypothetical protein [Arthrobacter stackebrandtii]MBP2413948.1 hypothetical protein [Arthrobacter stackebrandtii]PYH00509.1 hypothetical protein CVV67_10470 [Arthrobacter stackebrandtii]
MHIPRFILAAFITLVVGGTIVATTLLVSSSEPRLGDTIVVTPHGTPPPSRTPTPAPEPSATATPSPGPSASPTTAPPTDTSPTPPPPSSAPPAPPAPPADGGAVVVPGCAPLAGDDDCDDADDWDDPDDD